MFIVVLALAGRAAPGRASLSCLCKKVSKEARPAARVPALLEPRLGPQNSLRGCAATFKQLRPVRPRSMCATWHTCPPCALCASARVEGWWREPRACLLCVRGWKVLFNYVSRWRLLDQRWRLIWCWLLFEVLLAACRAAGDFLFLLSQEKEAKEGNPAARVPPLRSGQPAVLAPAGPAANSPAMQAQTARLAASVWGCAPRHG